jgi:hypothetical protein
MPSPLPTITPLPPAPSITSPATFEDDAEAFAGALPGFGDDFNALIGAVPEYVDEAIAEAVEAYNPGGAYSAAQVDTLLAQKAATDLSNVTQATARNKVGTGTAAYRNLTISTAAPSGGSNGDLWFKVA